MDKKILFKGLESFKIPKCDVLVDSIHDENGKPFNYFKIRIIPEKFIYYTNDTKIGVVPDNNPDKDLIAAIMELGDDPSTNNLVDFISSYGFFLSHTTTEDSKYIGYSEQTLRKYICYIQKIIQLLNSYIVYSQQNHQSSCTTDYTLLCNSLIDIIYTDSFNLYDGAESNISIINKKFELGFNYRNEFITSSKKLGLPRKEIGFDGEIPVSEYTCNPFNDFIKYRNEGRISIQFDSHNFVEDLNPTWTTYNEKKIYTFFYHLLEKDKLEYKESIYSFYDDYEIHEDLLARNKLYEIPYVNDLNGSDESTSSLQDELMSVIQIVINEQINNIIKNIYPKLISNDDKLALSWHFENLICVIFMELLNIEIGDFECRQCYKDACPFVGRYYFLVDVKNNIKKCYSTACRNRINKKLYDKKTNKANGRHFS